jgi:peptidoglycan/xylan/chitin deacetylase (PgdA/CDA1 family)
MYRMGTLSQGTYGARVGVPLILEFLNINELKATFFVPGWTAERYPQTVAEIYQQGHEIGHHGYLHESVDGLSRAEEEEILEKGSRILTALTGEQPRGYRAPWWDITQETVGLLRKHGFRYSSNLMDSLWPYLHPGTPALVELPVQWLLDDGPFFAYGVRPPLYRQIFPPTAVLSAWKDEFRGMYGQQGAFILTLHPQFVGRPSRIAMLQELIDYIRSFSGVWFARGLELAEYVAVELAVNPR